MKKFLCLLAVLLPLAGVPGFAQTPQIHGESTVLYDALTGDLLFSRAERQRRGIASTTKIMTALVALEQYDPEAEVEIRQEWCGVEGSSMYLRPGERLTVSDLLYGLLLESGNDAAQALAGLDPHGPEAFVDKMNAKAQDLSLSDTHFCNPSGLDAPEHYSTALDLARLAAAALENPDFARIAATRSITLAGRTLNNHNRLLEEIGACGVKTGYTMACGRCLVSAKREQGRLLICVTLNDRQDWADHKALYAFGFAQYEAYALVGAGDCGSIPVYSAEKPSCRLYCNESFSFSLRQAERQRLQIALAGPRFCYGPVEAGQDYGSLQVLLDGKKLWETPVCFAETIAEQPEQRRQLPRWMEKIIQLFGRKTP